MRHHETAGKRILWINRVRRWSVGGVFAGCLLVLLVMQSPGSAQTVDYEHVQFGWPRDIVSLDPHGYRRLDRPEFNVHLHLFDHLLNRDNAGKIIPHLAERYEAVDNLTWRFYLR